MNLFFIFSTVKTPGSIVFRSECVRVTGHVCTLSLVLLQRTGTAVCAQSVCMVCVSGRKCVSVYVLNVHLHLCECVCVCVCVCACVHMYVWSRCWDLCVSLGRECRDPWTLLCFLLTRQAHTSTHTHTHIHTKSIRVRMRVALRQASQPLRTKRLRAHCPLLMHTHTHTHTHTNTYMQTHNYCI